MTRRSPPTSASALTIGELLGDGTNGRADNALRRRDDQERRACCAVAGERALYKRAISRTYAEWPLVEVCARAVVTAARSSSSASPPAASRRCRSGWRRGSRRAGQAGECRDHGRGRRAGGVGAKPLPMTGYKLDLLKGVVQDLLERLAG